MVMGKWHTRAEQTAEALKPRMTTFSLNDLFVMGGNLKVRIENQCYIVTTFLLSFTIKLVSQVRLYIILALICITALII